MSEEKKPEERLLSIRDLNPMLGDVMKELATPNIPQIEEREFIDKWLRLFSNITQEERDSVNDEATRRPIFLWVQEVSKNAQLPVDVFRGKEFLFRVPPVLADVQFNFRERHPNYDLAGEVATAQKKGQIIPQLGEEHFRDRVEKIVLPSFVLSLQHAVAWNEIFARYGMPVMDLTGEKKDVAKTPLIGESNTGELNLDDIHEL